MTHLFIFIRHDTNMTQIIQIDLIITYLQLLSCDTNIIIYSQLQIKTEENNTPGGRGVASSNLVIPTVENQRVTIYLVTLFLSPAV